MTPLHARARLVSLLSVVCLLLFSLPAQAGPCGDKSKLEMDAYRGKFTPETRACLENSADNAADPVERVESSFVLIVDAYQQNETEKYGLLMQRHLTELHTTDAEVAYLYARYLYKLGQHGDDVLHWARVAMDNRRRWLTNRANYDNMVRSLYDLLVQVSMERAIEVEQEAMAAPSEHNQERVDKYRRQARYYLLIAAPCLYYGDCGPYFEVEIEGWAPCDDLVALESAAQRGRVTAEQQTCLRSKYRKPQAPRARILAILMDQADTDAEGTVWEELMAWHWNLTGEDDAMLAFRYAEYLVVKGADDAENAMRWAKVALAGKETFTGRSGRAAVIKLHKMRTETAERMYENAKLEQKDDPSAVHREAVAAAKVRYQEAMDDYDKYCQESGGCN